MEEEQFKTVFEEWIKLEEKSSTERKIAILNGYSQALSAALNKDVQLVMMGDKSVTVLIDNHVVDEYSINLDGPLAVFNDTYHAFERKELLKY
jgi:hypothetical protein